MRKLIIVLLVMVLIFSGCSKEQESIEGYWMAENGETISFNSNGKAISDGMSMDYSLYGEDNLSISFWGIASEYRYTVKKDVLTLVDLNKNTTSIFYRDEEKQLEIQEKLNIKQDREEQEEIHKILSDTNELSEAALIKIVKIRLNVPDKDGITYSIGEKKYWDVGQRYYMDVEFYEKGENVAGAFVDPQTGELIRNIHLY